MVQSQAPTIPVLPGRTIPIPSYKMSPSVLHVMLANTVEPMDLVLFLVSWLGYILGAKKYSRRVFENVLAQSENQITN